MGAERTSMADRRNRRILIRRVGISLARALLLIAAASIAYYLLDVRFVSPFWFEHRWGSLMRDWLRNYASAFVVGHAGMAWVAAPTWFVAAFCGMLIGVLRPFSWAVDATIFSLAYIAIPDLCGAMDPTIGWPSAVLVAYEGLAIPLTLGAGFIGRRLRKKRQAFTDGHPHCARCGYDLTGLPERRCPECGELASGV